MQQIKYYKVCIKNLKISNLKRKRILMSLEQYMDYYVMYSVLLGSTMILKLML